MLKTVVAAILFFSISTKNSKLVQDHLMNIPIISKSYLSSGFWKDFWNFSQSEHIIGDLCSHAEYPISNKNSNLAKYHLMNIPAKLGAIQTTTDAKYLQ